MQLKRHITELLLVVFFLFKTGGPNDLSVRLPFWWIVVFDKALSSKTNYFTIDAWQLVPSQEFGFVGKDKAMTGRFNIRIMYKVMMLVACLPVGQHDNITMSVHCHKLVPILI